MRIRHDIRDDRFLLFGAVFLALTLPALAQTPPAGPRVAGYLQARETYAEGIGLTGTINRARVGVEGAVADGFAFKVTAELASGGSATVQFASSLRDAYVRWMHEGFSVWAGQFKTPFSAQYITSLKDVETADRAGVVDALAPKRDIGIMGDYDWRGRATASVGIFNGEGQNIGVNRDSAVLVVARVTARPLEALTLAADIARYRDSTRYGIEAGLRHAHFALAGEYVRQHRLAVGRDDEGWYLLGTYELLPWLQAVVQQEDLQRPAVPTLARNTATTIGANVFLADRHARLLVNYVSRKVGARRGTLVTEAQLSF
jgi:hypothetical protein